MNRNHAGPVAGAALQLPGDGNAARDAQGLQPAVSVVGRDAPLALIIHQGAELYGSDRVLLYLVEGLKGGGSFTPVVVLPEDGPLRRELARIGVEVHFGEVVKVDRGMFRVGRLLELPRLVIRAFRRLDQIVAGRPVALVHSNTLAVLGGALWARRRGLRHVWHVHEIILKPAWVARAFPKMVNVLSDRAIAVSAETRRWLLGIEPCLADKTVVVVNGLPDPGDDARVAGQPFREQLRASADDVVVTLAGRLNRWKGQGLLIEAAARLKAENRLGRMRFAIVGQTFTGQEHIRDDLIRQVEEAGLANWVVFVDFVQDIRFVWAGTDIAVVPSTDPEPFGMVAIEAMAAGLPVVAARHGGLTDIVDDGQTGLLFTPRDADALAQALCRLSDDAPLRVRFGNKGRARQVELFSVANQIQRIEAVYRAAVQT